MFCMKNTKKTRSSCAQKSPLPSCTDLTNISMKIKKLPLEERPRERLEAYGDLTLSKIELLAVILGSGTKGKSVLALSQELLSSFGSLNALARAGLSELCAIKGMGKAKAIQLKAAI